MTVQQVIEKYTSRKLWVAFSTIVALITAKQYSEAAGVAAAYVLSEAHVDAKKVTATAREVSAEIDRVADATDRAAV